MCLCKCMSVSNSIQQCRVRTQIHPKWGYNECTFNFELIDVVFTVVFSLTLIADTFLHYFLSTLAQVCYDFCPLCLQCESCNFL